MPISKDWVDIMAIRKGEMANDVGHLLCEVQGCNCLFFDRLSFLLHRSRGLHGRQNFETARRLRGNYYTRGDSRPKEILVQKDIAQKKLSL
jgi:hypothetical protein